MATKASDWHKKITCRTLDAKAGKRFKAGEEFCYDPRSRQESIYQIRGCHVYDVAVDTGPECLCLVKSHDNHYITNKTRDRQKEYSYCPNDIEHVGTLGIIDSVRVVHFPGQYSATDSEGKKGMKNGSKKLANSG